ncbi:MAG: tetratricopeptide repeat protein [Desulfobacterota bacterium]|nr:tetratricopeptide repeat protein [Thermodesulfobacteriota bacterium]
MPLHRIIPQGILFWFRSSTPVHSVLLAALPGVLYLQTLAGAFIWDDNGLILNFVEYLENASDISVLFFHTPFESAPYYRPVLWLSFFADYGLWGRQPFGFHLTNILLHMINVVLLYGTLRMLLFPISLCFVTAALFGAHPVNTEAVAWIAGRNDPLMFLFLMLTCLCMISGRRYCSRAGSTVFYMGAFVSYLLALFTKESAIVTLPLLLLVELRLGANHHGFRVGRAMLYGLLLVATAIFFIAQQGALQGRITNITVHTDVRSIATPFIIYLYYFKVLFFPINLTVDPSFYLRSVTDSIAPYICSAIVMVIVSAVLWCKRRWPEGCAGMVWVFIYLLPISGIMWMGVPILEHRAYGACAGFCFALASLWHRCRYAVMPRRLINDIATVLLCCILAGYGVLTIKRNHVWRDEITMWTDTLAKSPLSQQALINLGVVHLQRNDPNTALRYLQQALAISPRSEPAYLSLGTALFALGRIDEAVQAQHEAIKLNPRSAEAYNNLGILHKEQGVTEQAAAFFEKAISLKPTFSDPYVHLAHLYANAGAYDKAITILHKGCTVLPRSSIIFNALGKVYEQMQNINAAREHYTKAVDADPNNCEARTNLVLCLIKLQRFKEALPHARQAVMLRADAPELYMNLGIIYMNLGLLAEAAHAYTKAIHLNNRYVEAYFNLGVTYFGMSGKEKEGIACFEKVLELQHDYPNRELILNILKKKKADILP